MDKQAIVQAVDDLGAIPYFPGDAGARAAIMRQISMFAETEARLRWTVDTAIQRMTAWQGVGQVRALYATRWRPLDGQEGPICEVTGFTPGDCERQYLETHHDPPKQVEAKERRELEASGPIQRRDLEMLLIGDGKPRINPEVKPSGRPILRPVEMRPGENELEALQRQMRESEPRPKLGAIDVQAQLLEDFGSKEKLEEWRRKGMEAEATAHASTAPDGAPGDGEPPA